MKQEIPAELDTGSDDRKAKLTKLQAHWQTRVGVPGDHRASDSKSSELSFTTRVAKASKEECEDEEKVSQHLDNLVRLVTVARRKEVGDIVWFCYNEQDEPKKGSPSPLFGSTGLAVTIPGARWIKQEMPKMTVWHFDVELKKRLELGKAKASYIFPTVGHFETHASGILKHNATRKSTWGAWYVQEGVAPKYFWHVDRQLWRWNPSEKEGGGKGEVSLVTVISLDEPNWPKLAWKTFFKKSQKLREPIASQDAASGSTAAPPPEPLTQEQMREQFDMDLMVKNRCCPWNSQAARLQTPKDGCEVSHFHRELA